MYVYYVGIYYEMSGRKETGRKNVDASLRGIAFLHRYHLRRSVSSLIHFTYTNCVYVSVCVSVCVCARVRGLTEE